MIKVSNHLGTIGISAKYLRSLITSTAESCFGVAGMNPYGAIQGVDALVNRRSASNQGVIIRQHDNKLIIDLHITVTYGVNVNAITESIVHKVEYVLAEQAGVEADTINVYVDGMVN